MIRFRRLAERVDSGSKQKAHTGMPYYFIFVTAKDVFPNNGYYRGY